MLSKLKPGISLVLPIALALGTIIWQPGVASAACGDPSGHASFSDLGVSGPGNYYYFDIIDGPPNTSGALYASRNGQSSVVTENWILTDALGDARRGPWTPTSNETAVVFIRWDNGCRTNTVTHINDVTRPTVTINQVGGTGTPIPSTFSGTASDAQWGTGFDFQAWSSVYVAFQNTTTGLYWNGGYCYCDPNPRGYYGTASPLKGFNITWQATPPPPSAHRRTDNYKWSVGGIRDRVFPSETKFIYFNLPSNGT